MKTEVVLKCGRAKCVNVGGSFNENRGCIEILIKYQTVLFLFGLMKTEVVLKYLFKLIRNTGIY